MSAAPGLLVIEEQPEQRRAIAALLRKQGYTVSEADSADTGLRIAAEQPIALTLINDSGEDMDGVEIIRRLRQQAPGTEAVVLAARCSADAAASTLGAGAQDYFARPIEDWVRFHAVIDRCLAHWQPHLRVPASPAAEGALEALKGNSEAMRVLQQQIRCLAPLPDPLLIRGESGTGKELVARAVHEQSPWREGPFVAVNCAALTSELFESELFGHRTGAFTGASREHAGLVEQARGGTLFLDEVGELPQTHQAKLLRLLEQREYRRVGGERHRTLAARVLAATHVDLEAAIDAGRFRQDLYFRLSALEIEVPTLRERLGDVQLLAYHFLDRYNRRYNRNIRRIAPDALRMLESAEWARNNVRELEWSIRQAVARSHDADQLTAAAFRGRLTVPAPSALTLTASTAAGADGDTLAISDLLEQDYGDALKEIRRRFAREYASRRLVEANYNKSRAAELSGMKRSNFSRLVRELGLETPDSDG